jgi:signal transduction histidine kinase
MKPAANNQGGRTWVTTARRLVVTAFVLVACGVLLATAFAIVQTRDIQGSTRSIVENMTASYHLLAEVGSLIQRRRILVDDHIYAKDPGEMAELERQIAVIDRQLTVASHDYEPWATYPRERDTWNRTRQSLAALDEPMARALALSRVNKDSEARDVMRSAASQFEAINHDIDELVAINDRGTVVSFAQLDDVRHRLQLIQFAVGCVALALTALLGAWAARQVGRRERSLATAAYELAKRNRDLDAFAGRVAHDVRSPLASIKLVSTTLSEQERPTHRTLAVLRRSTQRMEALVDDLMTLALSDVASHGHCDPAAVVQQLQDDFKQRIDAEKGNLHLSVSHAEVACSEGLLQQALTNLLENAVKYHRPRVPPVVEVTGAPGDSGYVLRVTDNGMGMSEQDAARAFEPFYRSVQASELPGTGLGLSIVNRIAEASGGSLSLHTKEGEGSTFVMQLPLAAPRTTGG